MTTQITVFDTKTYNVYNYFYIRMGMIVELYQIVLESYPYDLLTKIKEGLYEKIYTIK